MVDYFACIHKYIPPTSLLYSYYLPHVMLVTQKALQAAHRLGLSAEQLRFIEEAAMLHDIGITKVKAEAIGCTGSLPYLCHLVEGYKILEVEGLLPHALIAERHAGVGLFVSDIQTQGLPLPHRDMVPETIEEKIISWADLFYSKNPKKLWIEKTPQKVKQGLAKWGQAKVDQFEAWQREFENPALL